MLKGVAVPGWAAQASGVHRVGRRDRARAFGAAAAEAEFTPNLHQLHRPNHPTPMASLHFSPEHPHLTQNLLWGGGAPGAYSKPSAVAGKQSSDSYTKPKGGTPGSATTSTFKGGSQFDRKMVQQVKQEKAKASLDSYRAETGKFQKPAGSTGRSPLGSLTNRVRFTKKFTITEGSIMEPIMAAAIHFIVAWDLDAPGFAYGMAPSYGIWDTLFLFMILDRFSDRNHSAMAYHHANDPGYQAWRTRRGQSG